MRFGSLMSMPGVKMGLSPDATMHRGMFEKRFESS